MTEPSRPPDTGTRPAREATTGLPRWLYLAGVVTAILILVAVALWFTGGGLAGHQPPPHAAPGDAGSHTRPRGVKRDHSPSVGFHGHTPPEGAHE